MDGTNDETVVLGQPGDMYDGLTIDEDNNILYWTVTAFSSDGTSRHSFIRCLSIAEFEGQAQGVSGRKKGREMMGK